MIRVYRKCCNMGESQPHAISTSQQTSRQDVSLRPILIFAAVLVGITGLTLLGMNWLFTSAMTRQARLDAPPAPMAQSASPLPPAPRLQVQPGQDWQQIQAQEEALLHSYSWVDESNGIVRIPITRAMELIVERGLPGRAMPPSAVHPGSQGAP